MAFDPSAFNTKLCDCFDDCPSCLDGTFCAYCQISSQYNVMVYGKREVYLPLCAGLFCLDMVTGGAGIVGGSICLRSTVVQRYLITDEDSVTTCCVGFWCPACSICQVYREMSMRHEWPGGICVDKPFQHPLGICAPEIPTMNAIPIAGVVLTEGAHSQGGGAGGPYHNVYAGNGYGEPPAPQMPQQPYPSPQRPQPYYYGNATPQYGQAQATALATPPAKHEPYIGNAHQRV